MQISFPHDKALLSIQDLESLYTLMDWVRKNSNKFLDKEIPKAQMSLILNYLSDIITAANIENKKEWNIAIEGLRKKNDNR